MGGNPFSKKMCHELLLFEDYLLSCKTALFHKEQIIVNRDRTLSLITELRSYHCADRSAGDMEETLIPSAPPQSLPEPEIEPQPQPEPEPLPEKVIEFPKRSAVRAKAAECEAHPSEAEIEQAVREAAQKEAERILAEAREQAKYIINEANIKADVLLGQAEEKIQEKQKQVDELLLVKINDADRRAKEIVERAHQTAIMDLETKNKQVRDMLLVSFQKADHLIEIAESVYAKQLEVVQEDRQQILDILDQLNRLREE